VPLVTLQQVRLSGVDAILKRGLDLVGASAALLVLGLPALAVLVAGLLSGRSPLVRRRLIYGVGGQSFHLWLVAREVCATLPFSGVPALFAVLAGRMSLVGPRPVACAQDGDMPVSMTLTALPPGLTGPWRLSGPTASLEDQALLDLAYLRNYTVWEDIRIIWRSIQRVRRDRRASSLDRWQDRVEPLSDRMIESGRGA
jgi:lipopolysaccharide/colanic/teichoic acid biosynthesis glycosyltransferase